MAGRAADVSFVLDELAGARPDWPAAALIDPSRIAITGHSIGGGGAIGALLADSRIRAGIDMDGTLHAPIPDRGLSQPFLFLGEQSNVEAHLPAARSLDITRAYVRPSSTSTCAVSRKPCLISRHRATPRSRSAPRERAARADRTRPG